MITNFMCHTDADHTRIRNEKLQSIVSVLIFENFLKFLFMFVIFFLTFVNFVNKI